MKLATNHKPFDLCKLIFEKPVNAFAILRTGLILGSRPTNGRGRYKVMPSYWLGTNLESTLIHSGRNMELIGETNFTLILIWIIYK